MRRLRYGLNVVALERNLVPPEGPFDVALTNGLAAIVSVEDPGAERNKEGRMLAARALLKVLEDAGGALDFAALREAIDITQPLRHARADDEFLTPVRRHLQALIDIDHHPALLVLDQARATPNVDELVAELYTKAAGEARGISGMPPKDRSDQPDFEECDECLRKTLFLFGFDEFGGTNSPGECVACGYERDAETARRLALDAEWERVKDEF